MVPLVRMMGLDSTSITTPSQLIHADHANLDHQLSRRSESCRGGVGRWRRRGAGGYIARGASRGTTGAGLRQWGQRGECLPLCDRPREERIGQAREALSYPLAERLRELDDRDRE